MSVAIFAASAAQLTSSLLAFCTPTRKLGSDNAAFGWSSAGLGGTSSCPVGAQDVHYDLRSLIQVDANTTSGAMPTLNVGLKAESISARPR